ncbi:MAG: hypothetical protein AAF502_19890 [Bacteroidota bacterium]
MSLLKMTILSFTEPADLPIPIPVNLYMCMFNPESYKIENDIQYNDEQSIGEESWSPVYKGIAPRKFTFDFLIDGTGAAGSKREVFLDVMGFKSAVDFNPLINRTPYLLLMWGTMILNCVIDSYSINYTLFRPDGTPLRATISATFMEFKSDTFKAVENAVTAGGLITSIAGAAVNLTTIATESMGSPDFHIDIAKANDMDSPRASTTGNPVSIPPTG